MKGAMNQQYDTLLCIRGEKITCLEWKAPGFDDWAETYMSIQQYGRNNSDVSVLSAPTQCMHMKHSDQDSLPLSLNAVCVRACVHECVRACVHVRACVRACLHA